MKRLILFILTIIFFSCTERQNQSLQNEIRIISLAPNITETIYALNVESKLVAVTDFCKFPPDVQSKEKIGGLLNPNIEKIVALKPTHLFGLPAHSRLNQELQKFGFDIIKIPNETINDLRKGIKLISDTLGVSAIGDQLLTSINDSLQVLRIDNKNQKKIKAMLIIGREKGSINNITVAGPNTYIDEIWNLVGGENIFHDLAAKYSAVNLEEIVKRDPKIIIEFDVSLPNGVHKRDTGEEWQPLKEIGAVSDSNHFVIGGNYALIPGPRITKLAKDFKQIINTVPKL